MKNCETKTIVEARLTPPPPPVPSAELGVEVIVIDD
jgi:hypothetical protein